MTRQSAPDLRPRKRPRLSRSQATVDAILGAVVQVMLADGFERLTVARVAERAGVSIGTLYQYYPNKDALLFGVLRRHMGRIEDAVRTCAAQLPGESLACIAEAVTDAFVRAKLADLDEAIALCEVSECDTAVDLCRKACREAQQLLAELLRSASDATVDDPELVAFVWFNTMIVLTRGFLDGDARVTDAAAQVQELQQVCRAYVERAAARA